MKPFELGDIFLGCTELIEDIDDHKGNGRILQYDKDFNLKGILWTEGTDHLVIGLKIDPKGILWAFDMHNHIVIRVSPDGKQLPNHHFANRAFSNVTFDKDGNIYLGEALVGNTPYPGSYMKRLPGSDLLGEANIYKFDSALQLQEIYDVAYSPEFHHFKGITHSTMHPSEAFITYTTEIGKKIMRYDIQQSKQMDDLLVLPGDLTDQNVAIAVNYLNDGRLLHSRGDRIEILNEDGAIIQTIGLEEHGWGIAQVSPSYDQEHFFTANIFTGVAMKIRISDGEILGSIDTGYRAPKRSLAGIAEYGSLKDS
ncbi:MAG: hypothetical protein VYE26_05145 [Pseudomonadota bacterium]|nr:hypothetical protein [Pseudomonadota bacterium]|tara:strand:- start:1751 stop:2683 length:933 start_codon:yes stop_codon:yes gene_type:complete